MSPIAHKRIPTLLGLILLVGTLSLTSFLVRRNLNFFSNAAPDTTPQRVTITNITSSSFTVTYTTGSLAIGSVQYGTQNPKEQLVNDERDSGVPQNHTVHSIRISGLTAKTAYSFTILSDGTTYLNNGQAYHIQTAEAKDSTYKSITGTISTPDSTPVGEALVIVTGSGITPVSALASTNGTYQISLNKVPLSLSDTTPLTITVLTANAQGKVTTTFGQTHPVPLITLSQTFDFTVNANLFSTEVASSSGDISSLPASSTTNKTPQNPTITTPYKDQKFTDQQPTFSGNALPNATVAISIKSTDEITATVKANTSGSWSYRPTKPLTPGNHSITITTKDAFGIIKPLQQSFIILAAGSQVDSAPSVAPTKSPTPTTAAPTGTPVPTNTPMPTPTTGALTPTTAVTPTTEPTAAPTVVPTAIPTVAPTIAPTRIATGPTATPPPLENFKTGSSTSVIVAILGGIMTAIGLTIFVLSRGSGFL